MIDKILSISGKPGLFRLIGRGKNMLICENLADKKRIPAMQRDKVLSLADIAMYTVDGEVPLNTVFGKAKALTQGKIAPVALSAPADEQRAWFAQVMPEYDADRVRACDIKKFIQWYNILIKNGITDFEAVLAPTEGDNVDDRQEQEAAE